MFVDYSSQNKFMRINSKFAEKYLEMLYIEKLSSPEDRLRCLKLRTKGRGTKIIQNLKINDFAGDYNWIIYLYGLVLSTEQMLESGKLLLGCPTLYMVEFALQGCRIEDAFSERSSLSSQLKLAVKCAYYEFIGPCEKIIHSLRVHFLSLRPRYGLPFNRFGYFQKVLYNEMFTNQVGTYKIHAGLLMMPFKFPSSYRALISEEGYPKSNIKVRFHKWSGRLTNNDLSKLEMNDVEPFCIENKVISVWKQGHSSELFGHYSYMLRLGKLPSNEEPPSETTVVMKDIKARSAKRTEKLQQFEDLVSSGNSWVTQKRYGVDLIYESADTSFKDCQNSLGNRTDLTDDVLELKARSSDRFRKLSGDAVKSDSTACTTSMQGDSDLPRRSEEFTASSVKEECKSTPIGLSSAAEGTSGVSDKTVRKTSSRVCKNNVINHSHYNEHSKLKDQQKKVSAKCGNLLLPKISLLVKSGTTGYREMTELEKDIYRLLESRQMQRGVENEAALPSGSNPINIEKAKKFKQVRQELMENEEEFLFSSDKAGPPLSGDGIIDRHLKIAASTHRSQNTINPNLVKSLKPVSEIIAIIEKAERVVGEHDLIDQIEKIDQELNRPESLGLLSSSRPGNLINNYSAAQSYSSREVSMNRRKKNKHLDFSKQLAYTPRKDPSPNALIAKNKVSFSFDSRKLIDSLDTSNSEQSVVIRSHLFPPQHKPQGQVHTFPEDQKENYVNLPKELPKNANDSVSLCGSPEILKKYYVQGRPHAADANDSMEAKGRPDLSSCEAVFSYEPSGSSPVCLGDPPVERFLDYRDRNLALLPPSKDLESYSASLPCSPTFSEAASPATSHTRPLDLECRNVSRSFNSTSWARKELHSVEGGCVGTELPIFRLNADDPDLIYRTYMADSHDCLRQPEVIFRKPSEQRPNGLTHKLRKFMSSHSSPKKTTRSEPTYQEMYPALSNIRFRDFLRFKSRKLREDVRYFSHVAKLCVTDFKERPITAERELYEQFK
ncbi:LAQU0S02e04830g1_1 [Lachancea quebecensis]|uniref:LAQU0S02e04830g1_1 n=1 Tax=Lachancea quebecensis TaxID=1654605 RepID=A0A0P1KW79_9SACH|nr:LAQU0S02e04830g1_1 [Lachancea quebecensis]